jgi:arginine decarboxylase
MRGWRRLMLLDQRRAPLYEAAVRYRQQVRWALHVPGHKLGAAAPPALRAELGGALGLDLTEAPGMDDLHAPEGVIAEAEALAADAFGAASSYMLVGGTTAGLHALVLAAVQPGEAILVPRNAHRSILGAIILSGARPVWAPVQFHPELDVATGVDPAAFARLLPGVRAALLVHPTYYGMVGPVAALIEAAHHHNVPVLVDEAHGTHFHFHPALPPDALSLGADGVVQSTHKTGGSLTQSSLCHLGHGARLSGARLREMLRLVQSTSPSYLLMASLDLARRHLALHGQSEWDRTLELAREAARRIDALPGLLVYPTADPTKLLIGVRGRGLTGFQAADLLWESGVAVETAGHGYLLAVLTPGDSAETIESLVQALERLPEGLQGPATWSPPPASEAVLLPREAYLGAKESVTLAEAVGRIAAEMIAPYPPGIPVVVPGERISQELIEYLRAGRSLGAHFQGPSDPTLTRIQVVKE